jgi:MYXO-CTERM domain-containing protein
VPTEERVTVIRHNVFIKDSSLPSPDGVRPNLLVDGFPDSGPGSLDHYEVYGNFFFHNDAEALVQATGRVHVHDNVFVDSLQPALRMVNHEGKTVIDALVYNNTIYDTASGIVFSNAPSGVSLVAGNAIFSATPLSGTMTDEHDNVGAPVASAASYVVRPSKVLGEMDFFPISGSALHGAVVDVSKASSDIDYDRDFNGTPKDFSYRGAYQGEGQNPGFVLDDAFKPLPGAGTGGSTGAGGSSGGSSGAGASSSGGSPAGGIGGASGSGTAGSGALGGAGGSMGGATGAQPAQGGEDSGCACASAPRGSGSGVFGIALVAALLLRRAERAAIRARTTGGSGYFGRPATQRANARS